MAAVMVVIGGDPRFERSELISAAIGFAVAAIPEGLPALVTITLALGVQQMAKRNAIMRNLPAVETLGAVTTICSDKTGTLTKNEMTVRHVITRRGQYDVEGPGIRAAGSHHVRWAWVRSRAVSRSAGPGHGHGGGHDSQVAQDEGLWRVLGEPTEGALCTLGMKAEFDVDRFRRIAVVPFESVHKYMATLNQTPHGARAILLKGAPDRVLDRCSHQQDADGRAQPLDRQFWDEQIDHLSNQGLRVLAAAMRPASEDQTVLDHEDLSGMVFLGLVGIVDPPRPDAIEAIATCQQAGIVVKMITGDHAGTATAISREMGIVGDGGPAAVSGPELERATNTELQKIVESSDTFARTSPEHKLRLVKALQANGRS